MKILLLLCTFFQLCGYAQKRDSVLKYFDANLNFTTKKAAAYAGIAFKQDGWWFMYALYPDTSYLLKAYYKDKKLTVKEGPYELFYPENKPAVAGFYHDNNRVGVWRSWHPNGRLRDSGFVETDQLSGLWKIWYADGQLKEACYFKPDTSASALSLTEVRALLQSGTRGLRHGAYSSWYQNGNLETTGTFANDSMNGRWIWYHENGNRSTIEDYENGAVVSLQCFDTAGAAQGELCSLSKPPLLRQYGDYKNYIAQHLLWPEEALKKKIEGTVHVQFRVSKWGRLENLSIDTNQPILEKAVKELFATMTDWLPAISHNRTVDATEELAIPFFKDH